MKNLKLKNMTISFPDENGDIEFMIENDSGNHNMVECVEKEHLKKIINHLNKCEVINRTETSLLEHRSMKELLVKLYGHYTETRPYDIFASVTCLYVMKKITRDEKELLMTYLFVNNAEKLKPGKETERWICKHIKIS